MDKERNRRDKADGLKQTVLIFKKNNGTHEQTEAEMRDNVVSERERERDTQRQKVKLKT